MARSARHEDRIIRLRVGWMEEEEEEEEEEGGVCTCEPVPKAQALAA